MSLAHALHAAGFPIAEVVYRRGGQSQRSASRLARSVGAKALAFDNATFSAAITWLCVADSDLDGCARALANRDWYRKLVFHASGALASDVLDPLRRRGASVAAVHPMMSFVRGARTPLDGVAFSLEGDAGALRAARRIVTATGGKPFVIRKEAKPLYHAFGAFTSPLLMAALAAGERVALAAGLNPKHTRAATVPILEQTVRNYAKGGTAGAFTGPIVRGDVDTIRKHLNALRAVPESREVYVALVRAALRMLPVKNAAQIARLLKGK